MRYYGWIDDSVVPPLLTAEGRRFLAELGPIGGGRVG